MKVELQFHTKYKKKIIIDQSNRSFTFTTKNSVTQIPNFWDIGIYEFKRIPNFGDKGLKWLNVLREIYNKERKKTQLFETRQFRIYILQNTTFNMSIKENWMIETHNFCETCF